MISAMDVCFVFICIVLYYVGRGIATGQCHLQKGTRLCHVAACTRIVIQNDGLIGIRFYRRWRGVHMTVCYGTICKGPLIINLK
jgi:hypothetical protein